MWDELYTWMEEHSGCSFDLREDIERVSGDEAFTDTHAWYHNMQYVLDRLSDACDVVDENWKYLPDTLPNRTEFKKLIVSDTLSGLVKIIKHIDQKLHIEYEDITSVDELESTIETLYDIIEELRTHTVDEIYKTGWFEDYDDENNQVLTEKFGLHKNDIPNMYDTVQSIIALYEEEDEDE